MKKPGCLRSGLYYLLILVGLGVTMVSSRLYVELFQKAPCYQYARRQDLPDVEYLKLTEVVIATGRFHGHECRFTDTRTGYPITVSFAKSDIPYFTDTMQVVLGMFLPFICFVVIGAKIIDNFLEKIQRKRPRPPSLSK